MTIALIASGDAVSLGTGTTKTELTPATGVPMPADAKMLLGVIGNVANITPTTLQSITAKLELESVDIRNLQPYQVLFPPIGAGLGATFNTLTGREYWPINVRLGGGEYVHVWGTALVANAVAPKAQAFMVVSNDLNDVGQVSHYQAKIGTLTATGTTADTDVAGTPYSITNALAITELFGLFHPKIIAAGDAILGQIKYISTEFRDPMTQILPLYANSFGLGATGSMLIPGVSRQKVMVPVKQTVNQVNISDYLRCSLLPASAGSFIDGVMYVPKE